MQSFLLQESMLSLYNIILDEKIVNYDFSAYVKYSIITSQY